MFARLLLRPACRLGVSLARPLLRSPYVPRVARLLRPVAFIRTKGTIIIAAKMCDCGKKGGSWGEAEPSKEEVKEAVRERYGSIAKTASEKPSESAVHVAKSMGYSDEELAALPDGANMGLQCGNPTAMASLKPGEKVVDLGSGGGLDVFLASKKVGPTGKAVGLDMTVDMVRRARAAAERGKYTNVEFVVGEMEKMPLPSNEFDCIISNCVVNLSPDKPAVFGEMFRVLKPGGRVAISDMALRKALPPEIMKSVAARIGCVSGAMVIDDYARLLKAAGFVNVEVVDSRTDLNAYFEKPSANGACACQGGCCGGGAESVLDADLVSMLRQYDLNEFGLSAKITAYKPK